MGWDIGYGRHMVTAKVTSVSSSLHDLAGSLSVLMLCIPQLEKNLQDDQPESKELISLCAAALQEARQQLRTAQELLVEPHYFAPQNKATPSILHDGV